MKKFNPDILNDYSYSKFLTGNREILHDLNSQLKGITTRITTQHERMLEEIEELFYKINVSTAINQSYSDIRLSESIIKLKAILNDFKSKMDSNTSNLKVIRHILNKIDKLNEKIFTESDTLKDTDETEYVKAEIVNGNEPEKIVEKQEFTYKWITFRRNNSWFIVPFNEFEKIDTRERIKFINPENGFSEAILDSRRIFIMDFMKNLNNEDIYPKYILILNSGTSYYAADIIGKQIHSNRDIIHPLINEISGKNKRFYIGRVKIMGKNHFYINPDFIPRDKGIPGR